MKQLTIACSIFGLFAAAGCSGSASETTATVQVTWTLGIQTCAQHGVTQIDAKLIPSAGPAQSKRVDCVVGKATFVGVTRGIYSLELYGYVGNDQNPTFWGKSDTVLDIRNGGVAVIPEIKLSKIPAALDVVWKFSDGSLCSFAGVDTVSIEIEDASANSLTDQAAYAYLRELPCDPSLAKGASEDKVPGSKAFAAARGIVVQGLLGGDYTIRAAAYHSNSPGVTKFLATAQVKALVSGELRPLDLTLAPIGSAPAGGSSPRGTPGG